MSLSIFQFNIIHRIEQIVSLSLLYLYLDIQVQNTGQYMVSYIGAVSLYFAVWYHSLSSAISRLANIPECTAGPDSYLSLSLNTLVSQCGGCFAELHLSCSAMSATNTDTVAQMQNATLQIVRCIAHLKTHCREKSPIGGCSGWGWRSSAAALLTHSDCSSCDSHLKDIYFKTQPTHPFSTPPT